MANKTTKDVARQKGITRRRAQQLAKAGKAGRASKPAGHDWIIVGSGGSGSKRKSKKTKKRRAKK